MKLLQWITMGIFTSQAFAGSMAQTHDGFFLNMALGFAGGSMDIKGDGYKLENSGTTTLFNFRIGGCPIPNLAISADLQGVGMAGITQKMAGESQKADKDLTYTVSTLGLGTTYYIPDLFFVGATISPSGSLRVADDNDEEDSQGDMMGYSLRIGKEWWVSENWGLGVEFNYTHSTLSEVEDTDLDWVTNVYGVLFTATFN